MRPNGTALSKPTGGDKASCASLGAAPGCVSDVALRLGDGDAVLFDVDAMSPGDRKAHASRVLNGKAHASCVPTGQLYQSPGAETRRAVRALAQPWVANDTPFFSWQPRQG